jgi:hypothetical protein
MFESNWEYVTTMKKIKDGIYFFSHPSSGFSIICEGFASLC